MSFYLWTSNISNWVKECRSAAASVVVSKVYSNQMQMSACVRVPPPPPPPNSSLLCSYESGWNVSVSCTQTTVVSNIHLILYFCQNKDVLETKECFLGHRLMIVHWKSWDRLVYDRGRWTAVGCGDDDVVEQDTRAQMLHCSVDFCYTHQFNHINKSDDWQPPFGSVSYR